MNKILMFDTEHGSHTLGGEVEIQEMFNCPVLKPSTFEAFGNTINGIFIIDSFSELAKKYQRSLVNKDGVMQMQSWGKLKNKLDKTLEFITKMPGMLIVTCHSKVEMLEDGRTRIKPYIDGSTKEDISKWFDFVLYTYTKKNGNSQDYMWRTKHSEIYEHAKDRTDLLPSDMKQDFQLVIGAAKEKGFSNVRILIVGSPGTGKTRSLSTLINKGEENGN